MSVRSTIGNMLQDNLARAEAAIKQAQYQLTRMTYDHDTRDALENIYIPWRDRVKEAIDYLNEHPEIP